MWIVSEEEQANEFNIYFDYAQNVVNLDIEWLPVNKMLKQYRMF